VTRRMAGHAGAVLAVTLNANGAYCLTAGKDRTVRLWNPSKGVLVKTYSNAHAHEVRDVCCSVDNSRIASCGGDRQVFLCDVATGRTLRKFKGHDVAPVNAVRFGASDTVLVSGGYDAALRIWDCRSQSPEPIQVLRNFKDSVTSVIINDAEVIAASVDGGIRTFDVRTGEMVEDAFGGSPVTCVSLSHDSQCMLAGILDDSIALLDKASGELLARYEGHRNSQLKIGSCFTHDDALVVSGSEDGKVFFWDLVEGNVVHSFTADPDGAVSALAWHPEGDFLLTSSTKGDVCVWKPPRTG